MRVCLLICLSVCPCIYVSVFVAVYIKHTSTALLYSVTVYRAVCYRAHLHDTVLSASLGLNQSYDGLTG